MCVFVCRVRPGTVEEIIYVYTINETAFCLKWFIATMKNLKQAHKQKLNCVAQTPCIVGVQRRAK